MPEPTAETAKRMQIRKYPNRRYYDTTRSRHVTLDEIYQLIRDGSEVQVTDSKTGRDITAKVLAQIIIELDPQKLDVFPVPLLHRLLRSNERMINDFVEKYLNQPLTAFLDSQRNMEQYLRQAMRLKPPAPTVADWTKMMWGPFNPSLWGSEGASQRQEPGSAPSNGAADELRSALNELRNELAELKAVQTRRRKRKKQAT